MRADLSSRSMVEKRLLAWGSLDSSRSGGVPVLVHARTGDDIELKEREQPLGGRPVGGRASGRHAEGNSRRTGQT